MEKENSKKQIPLRLSSTLYKELAQWAEEDFRSINGQIEYLLTEAVRKRKKQKEICRQMDGIRNILGFNC